MTGVRPFGKEILNLAAEKFKQVLHIQIFGTIEQRRVSKIGMYLE